MERGARERPRSSRRRRKQSRRSQAVEAPPYYEDDVDGLGTDGRRSHRLPQMQVNLQHQQPLLPYAGPSYDVAPRQGHHSSQHPEEEDPFDRQPPHVAPRRHQDARSIHDSSRRRRPHRRRRRRSRSSVRSSSSHSRTEDPDAEQRTQTRTRTRHYERRGSHGNTGTSFHEWRSRSPARARSRPRKYPNKRSANPHIRLSHGSPPPSPSRSRSKQPSRSSSSFQSPRTSRSRRCHTPQRDRASRRRHRGDHQKTSRRSSAPRHGNDHYNHSSSSSSDYDGSSSSSDMLSSSRSSSVTTKSSVSVSSTRHSRRRHHHRSRSARRHNNRRRRHDHRRSNHGRRQSNSRERVVRNEQNRGGGGGGAGMNNPVPVAVASPGVVSEEEEEDHPQHSKPQPHSESSGVAVPSLNAHSDNRNDPNVSANDVRRQQRTKHKTKRPRSRSSHRRHRRHKRHCKRDDSKDRHKSRRHRRHGHEEEDSSASLSSSPTRRTHRTSRRIKGVAAVSKKERKKSATSSESCKDDTVGHFEGGPGTMVGIRYKIVRDVGLGTFGRVVECLDLNHHRPAALTSHARHGRHPQRHSTSTRDGSSHPDANHNNSTNSNATVAIKIVRNIKRYHESALIEADILQDVNKRGGRGRSLCGILLDRFDLPQGHYCLVFECLGPSLYDFLKQHDYRPFPLYCVRDFARQLLDALDFLHSFSLIHTDLKLENILLTTHQEIMYCGGGDRHNRRKRNRNRHDQQQQQQLVPASNKIKVIDFGGATYDHEKKSSVVNTRQYRAPEVILGLGWSMPSDLWSAGCIIAELYMGELLFATHDNAEHLALMEQTIGPFPRHMLDHQPHASCHNNNNNSLAQQVFDSHTGWHKMERVLSSSAMSHVRNVGPLETLVTDADLVQLLRSLLIIDPNVRATADQSLQSRFCTPSSTTT